VNLEQALADPFIVAVQRALHASPKGGEINEPTLIPAAVSLLLRVPARESPELLLIRRAEYEGDPWSGHVALPGGRMEPDDADLARTAERETLEEISLDISRQGRMLGSLRDVRPETTRLPPIIIRPFVAVVDDAVTLKLSDEVASAFWVPLSQIRHPSARVSSMIQARDERFEVRGYQLGQHFVWGLTERIVRDFLTISEWR
jgi:8-oxo-dGTP pyrophosphatase MutT (NUDIX family)